MAVTVKIVPKLPTEATCTLDISIGAVDRGTSPWTLTVTKTDNWGRAFGEAQRFSLSTEGVLTDLNRGQVCVWTAPKDAVATMASATSFLQDVLQAIADASLITTT